MFLIESGFIGFIGGVAGALLSWGVSFILNNLLVIASGVMMLLQSLGVQANLDLSFLMNSGMGTGSTMSIIPAVAGGVALVFATVIGILFRHCPPPTAPCGISALEAIPPRVSCGQSVYNCKKIPGLRRPGIFSAQKFPRGHRPRGPPHLNSQTLNSQL